MAQGQTTLALPGQCLYIGTIPFRSMGIGEMDASSSDRQGLKLITVDRGGDHEGPKPLARAPSDPIPLPTSKAPPPATLPQGAPVAAATSAPPRGRKGKLLMAGAAVI